MFDRARDAWRARQTSREHAKRVAAAFLNPDYQAFEDAYGVAPPEIVRRLYDCLQGPPPPFVVQAPDGAVLEVQGLVPLSADSIQEGQRHGWKRLVIGYESEGGLLLVDLESGLLFLDFPNYDVSDETDLSIDELLASVQAAGHADDD